MIKQFSRNGLSLIVIFGITLVSPYFLAKLGFWNTGHAETLAVPPASGFITSFSPAVKKAAPAVVSIFTQKEIQLELHPLFRDPFFRNFFGAPGSQMPKEQMPGLGSGVVVRQDGYILTNNHVIRDVDQITVKFSDSVSAEAKIVGVDPESDLAVLKVDLKNLPTIELGVSADKEVGDIVLAIGNPFGVGQTVTQGIISAMQRNHLGINTFENFIQTDAPINPGNSGGALVDINGKLIGINTAIATGTGSNVGIGFAIPIDLAREVMAELILKGHVTRGWLGISVRSLNPEIRKQLHYPKGEGTVIAGVVRGGPAHLAGLTPGDIVISLNGKETTEPTNLLKETSKLAPNKTYPIVIFRDGKTFDFQVVIGKRPTEEEAQQ